MSGGFRVLKPDGKIRLHVHYHKKTKSEPIVLNDQIMSETLGKSLNMFKISEAKSKYGFKLPASSSESFALWSNFQ